MKKVFLYTGLAVSALTILSCNNPSSNATGSNEEKKTDLTLETLTNNVDDAKQQLFLRLVDDVQTDSSVIYTAKTLFEKDTVGFKLEVLKNIKPGMTKEGKINEEQGFVKGAFKFSSIGAPSDNFVKALGKIFKTPTTGKMSSQTLLPTVFSSNYNVVDLEKKSTYSFKMFFDNKTEVEAEVFASLDTYRKSFQLSEKDSVFRKSILAAFEGE